MPTDITNPNPPVIRCKMRVLSVTSYMSLLGELEQERVELTAVHGVEGDENHQWSKWTPGANFVISIANPSAMNKLSKGHEYFVDFTAVPLEVIL